jgi:hypothetical protein
MIKKRHLKIARVALLYGTSCFLVWMALIQLMGWLVFPANDTKDEFTRMFRWTIEVSAEKILGLILMSVTAFLASRACRPDWKGGIATGIGAGVTVQLIAVIIYLARFGMSAYLDMANPWSTAFWTLDLSWWFASLGVRRQRAQEKVSAVRSPPSPLPP